MSVRFFGGILKRNLFITSKNRLSNNHNNYKIFLKCNQNKYLFTTSNNLLLNQSSYTTSKNRLITSLKIYDLKKNYFGNISTNSHKLAYSAITFEDIHFVGGILISGGFLLAYLFLGDNPLMALLISLFLFCLWPIFIIIFGYCGLHYLINGNKSIQKREKKEETGNL